MRKTIEQFILTSVAATLASQVYAGEFPNAISVTGSASAIGSDAGYNLGAVIPFSNKEEQTSLALNFDQYFLGADSSYFLAQFGIQNRIYESGLLGGYLKSGGFVFPAQKGLETNLGLNITLGLELRDKGSSHLALCSEFGYFLPMIHQTSVARGVGLNLGGKFYF
jgi:hypothetical protein